MSINDVNGHKEEDWRENARMQRLSTHGNTSACSSLQRTNPFCCTSCPSPFATLNFTAAPCPICLPLPVPSCLSTHIHMPATCCNPFVNTHPHKACPTANTETQTSFQSQWVLPVSTSAIQAATLSKEEPFVPYLTFPLSAINSIAVPCPVGTSLHPPPVASQTNRHAWLSHLISLSTETQRRPDAILLGGSE